MKKGQKLWTREELILAVNLYCKLPFGRLHRLNPEVIHLANLIGRTASSVAYKLVNFASLDPSLKTRGIKGASNASKLDAEIWNEFFNNWDILPFESEKMLAEFEHTTIEQLNHISVIDLPKEGKIRDQIVKVRVNQSFFRTSILASYNNTCCITGIQQPEFLIAGHIKPWSIDKNPRFQKFSWGVTGIKNNTTGTFLDQKDVIKRVGEQFMQIIHNHSVLRRHYNKAAELVPALDIDMINNFDPFTDAKT